MISIIGAGPIGCYTAYLLAKSGKKVQVFEKKKNIGLPIMCTGLITQRIFNILPLPENVILNKVNKVKVNSKDDSVLFNLKNPELIIDREKFELYLYNLAKKEGVKFYLEHEFNGIKEKKQDNSKNISLIIQHKGKEKIFSTDILIGADGPNSKIAKILNKKPKKIVMGMQARVKTLQDPSVYQVFLGKNYGTFSWIVPESRNISKIGILTNDNQKFKKLLENINGKIIDYPSGPIPLYQNINIHKKNIFIVGDSASQVKNTTGGGIIYGLLSAQCLANSIINKKNYRIAFNKKIKKSLILHNLVYKIMGSFDDKDFNKLVKLCKKDKIKKIIESFDREHPVKMLFLIVLNEPRFALFLFKLMGKL